MSHSSSTRIQEYIGDPVSDSPAIDRDTMEEIFQDIQGDILVKTGTLRMLEENFQLVQAMESFSNARTELGGEMSLSAQRSAYCLQ